jgi:hypothetical protein
MLIVLRFLCFFLHAIVFGERFLAHFPEGKLFPLSETTFLNPEPRPHAARDLGSGRTGRTGQRGARGKNSDG